MSGSAPVYDAALADSYVSHLAASGSVHVGPRALVSREGTRFAEPGSALTDAVLEQISGQMLDQPVDRALELDQRLSQELLVADIGSLVEAESDLKEIEDLHHHMRRVTHVCHTAGVSEITLQKLSVLKQALPRVYQRTLFGAWFATLAAFERKLSAQDIQLVLLAALHHDLGLLHIEPELVTKHSGLSNEEWAAVQRHVLISARIAVEFAAAPSRLTQLILQHHERCDGSGYPAGATEEQLDPLSGLITMSDMLFSLRFPRILLNRTTLPALVPFLMVNRKTFGRENGQAASALLQAARNRQPRSSDPANDSEHLREANAILGTLCTQLAALRQALESAPSSVASRSLFHLLEQLDWATQASGIGVESLTPWFERGLQEGISVHELEDMSNAALEIQWLLHRARRLASSLLPTLTDAESKRLTEHFLSLADQHMNPLAERLGIER